MVQSEVKKGVKKAPKFINNVKAKPWAKTHRLHSFSGLPKESLTLANNNGAAESVSYILDTNVRLDDAHQ